jgi:AraC-like DNA-binding protein
MPPEVVLRLTPLRYLKRIRLDRAMRLMAYDGYNSCAAARAVGYQPIHQSLTSFVSIKRMRDDTGTSSEKIGPIL